MERGEILVRYQKEPQRIEFSAEDELALLFLLLKLRDLSEDEVAIIHCFRQIDHTGFGRLEAVVIEGSLDTIHGTNTYKKKDFPKLQDNP